MFVVVFAHVWIINWWSRINYKAAAIEMLPFFFSFPFSPFSSFPSPCSQGNILPAAASGLMDPSSLQKTIRKSVTDSGYSYVTLWFSCQTFEYQLHWKLDGVDLNSSRRDCAVQKNRGKILCFSARGNQCGKCWSPYISAVTNQLAESLTALFLYPKNVINKLLLCSKVTSCSSM